MVKHRKIGLEAFRSKEQRDTFCVSFSCFCLSESGSTWMLFEQQRIDDSDIESLTPQENRKIFTASVYAVCNQTVEYTLLFPAFLVYWM